mmetsp:Transcript_43063/g.79902  ORF Transcript_43063/g.79902 Transcript_43063/m.79902 type:complete len:270 (+) Transcript_43063:751-1560(+)
MGSASSSLEEATPPPKLVLSSPSAAVECPPTEKLAEAHVVSSPSREPPLRTPPRRALSDDTPSSTGGRTPPWAMLTASFSSASAAPRRGEPPRCFRWNTDRTRVGTIDPKAFRRELRRRRLRSEVVVDAPLPRPVEVEVVDEVLAEEVATEAEAVVVSSSLPFPSLFPPLSPFSSSASSLLPFPVAAVIAIATAESSWVSPPSPRALRLASSILLIISRSSSLSSSHLPFAIFPLALFASAALFLIVARCASKGLAPAGMAPGSVDQVL